MSTAVSVAAPPGPRRFRPDIQGLRAVAVLLVVLYHAGLPLLNAGYVGVDVFFVISGFLITGQLLREVTDVGRVHFLSFYARRMRRLLPSALLVVIATLVIARTWAPPLQVKSVSTDAIYSALYAINYHLAALGVDYQHVGNAASPLQHMWSLAVEEQFYLLWPLLITACVLLGRRYRTQLLIAVLTATVGYSLYLSITITSLNSSLAYFSIQTRAWELGLGGLVALASHRLAKLPGRAAALLAWAGLGALLISAFVYDDNTLFPGAAALLPVSGAALFIAAGCSASASGSRWSPERLLDIRSIQGVGKVSYAWYLWHWPLVVLMPIIAGYPFSWERKLEVMVLALWLAVLTQYIVEYPTQRSRLRKPVWLTAGVGLSAATVAVALLAVATLPTLVGTGQAQTLAVRTTAADAAYTARVAYVVAASESVSQAPASLTPAVGAASKDMPETSFDGCHANLFQIGQGPCVFGDVHASKTVVLFGDSHAEQWQPAFAEAGRREHWRVVSWTKVACPVAQVDVTNAQLKRTYTECLTWRAQTIARILALKPSLVVMGQSDAVFGTAQSQYFSNPGIAQQTVATMNIFRSAGIAVNYLLDTPYPAQNVPDCIAGHLSDIHYCGRGNYQTYLTARRAAMQQGLGRAGYSTIDSAPWICSTRFCPAVVGNLLVYRDETHLSASYSRWLAPLVQPLLHSVHATPAPAHAGLAGAQH